MWDKNVSFTDFARLGWKRNFCLVFYLTGSSFKTSLAKDLALIDHLNGKQPLHKAILK